MASLSNKNRLAQVWCVLAALIVLAVGGINLAQTARLVPPAPRHPPRVPADSALRSEQRFGRVRAALGARGIKGTIGYVTDLPPEKMRDDPASMLEFFLAQFALVPVVLDTEADVPTWALANLHAASVAERMPAGFHVVEDFGGGVFLLRKEDR